MIISNLEQRQRQPNILTCSHKTETKKKTEKDSGSPGMLDVYLFFNRLHEKHQIISVLCATCSVSIIMTCILHSKDALIEIGFYICNVYLFDSVWF